MSLRYLILGAGGIGGALGAHLLRGGLEVSFIARGRQLEALTRDGLTLEKPGETFSLGPVRAWDTATWSGEADVVFLCVKGYSLEETVPFLRRAAGKGTAIIPLLNLPDTGDYLRKRLPDTLTASGCIYIASEVSAPGHILMRGSILRVIFGLPGGERPPILEAVREDLTGCGIEAVLSENIRRDCLMKFSYVSPQGACGLYYGVAAGAMQRPGEARDCFAALTEEIRLLAGAEGVDLGQDLKERNLAILDGVEPSMTTSLQRDVEKGGPSELDGLVFRVPEWGRERGVRLPTYERIAAALRAKGLSDHD